MNTAVTDRPAKQNVYAEMARASIRAMNEVCKDLIVDAPKASQKIPLEAFTAFAGLWHRLVWSDRSLKVTECVILDVLHEEARNSGVELHGSEGMEVAEGGIPPVIQRVCAYDRVHGTQLTESTMVSLESFGYALLASDRKITQDEIDSLHDFMLHLRSWAASPTNG